MKFSTKVANQLPNSENPSAASRLSIFQPTQHHADLRDMVRKFAEENVDWEIAMRYNEEEMFNMDLFRKCGQLGLIGATVSEQYGGSNMDAIASCIIHEELSAADPAFTLSYLAHSLLFVNNLFQNGNDEQKTRFLPAACSGDIIGGMGMSEPDHGTDVLGMKTKAVRDNSTKEYVLNGSKMWITNGCVDDKTLGDVFLVYAKTAPKGVSLFLVEKGMKGFSLGQRIKNKCGMRASPTAELVFEDVRIPEKNLVGQEGGAVLCMMKNLEIERVGLAAMSCGIARRCVEKMNKYAEERKAFGKPIKDFGQIQRYIGNSYAHLMAGRTYLYNVASELNLSKAGNRLSTDAVKLFTTTMAKEVADNAMQVLGGNGYIGDYQVERLWRDAKLLEIGGGTLESHQKNMCRELQGIHRII